MLLPVKEFSNLKPSISHRIATKFRFVVSAHFQFSPSILCKRPPVRAGSLRNFVACQLPRQKIRASFIYSFIRVKFRLLRHYVLLESRNSQNCNWSFGSYSGNARQQDDNIFFVLVIQDFSSAMIQYNGIHCLSP